jgi:hypothetical protein
MQRPLMQFSKPANYLTERETRLEAGRADLIGNSSDAPIPAQPPKEAIEARRRLAHDPDHYHTVANPAKGERVLPNKGYRPGRKTQMRRPGKKYGGGSAR